MISLKKYLIILMLSILFVSSIGADIRTMKDAESWCDNAMMSPIEGIWEYPGDDTFVLVCKSKSSNAYDMIVIETPDTRLNPGDILGKLKPTPISTKFELELYRDKKRGVFSNMAKCVATLNEQENAIIVKSSKLNINIGSRWFLPKFWRAIKVNFDNPASELPKGLIRVYPPNNSKYPDYL